MPAATAAPAPPDDPPEASCIDRLLESGEGRFEDEFMPPHNADELRATMLATMRRIGLAHQGQKVVAASHGGATNSFLAAVLDSPRRFFFNPGYASISRVQVWPDGRFVLLCINELTHPRDRGPGLLPIG